MINGFVHCIYKLIWFPSDHFNTYRRLKWCDVEGAEGENGFSSISSLILFEIESNEIKSNSDHQYYIIEFSLRFTFSHIIEANFDPLSSVSNTFQNQSILNLHVSFNFTDCIWFKIISIWFRWRFCFHSQI